MAQSPRQLVLDFIRKLAGRELGSDPAHSVPPWFLAQILASVPALAALEDGL